MNIDLSLQYLELMMRRIEILVRREVYRWQKAGQNPEDRFRGLYFSDAQAMDLLQRPFGTSWGQMVTLAPQDAQTFEQALAQLNRQTHTLRAQAQKRGVMPRLELIQSAFSLSPFEVDAFLIALAPYLDLRYERLYGYLQDDVTRKRATVNLVLDLLCEAGVGRMLYLKHFGDEAPLFKHHLLHRNVEGNDTTAPLLGQTLSADPDVVAWLLDAYHPPRNLGFRLVMQPPDTGEIQALLTEPQRAALDRTLKDPTALLVFYGPDETGQQAAAHYLALHRKQPLLLADLRLAAENTISPAEMLDLAARDARLNGALLCLLGWDTVLSDAAPPPALLADACAVPPPMIIGGNLRWQPKGVERQRRLRWLNFPIPDYPQRIALWQHFTRTAALPAAVTSDLNNLAGQFLLTTGQIRDAVATARDIAAQSTRAVQRPDLFAAARSHSNPRLAEMARKIEPRYTWDDLILPPDQITILQELVSTVRGRPTVLETWGVGRKLVSSTGITVLFAGPPGTGKTMSAEVIANELGLDLYKIDLSTVVSKYIGETEKNLERIFSEAQNSNAILFFDEADAIFGKRSEVKDAHDRYANIEVSYLLQRMEAYNGVTILATNLRANIDEAFTRRLHFALDIPFPETEYRLRIWETLFPADVPRAADLDFKLLAERFKLAGGSIRNIIVGAAYLAAAESDAVNMAHLFHATRRELQKMGRLVNESALIREEKAAQNASNPEQL